MTTERKILIAAVAISLIGLLAFVFWETKPKPGQLLEDQGRGHVQIGTDVKYNSNPPTSGPHYEDWAKAGFFDSVIDDRNLVHALEHGYVIMSYNCSVAQESTNSASPSATLPPQFSSQSCQDLVKQLTNVYNDKSQKKLIVIPRPNMDTQIALTAWRYIDKLNSFDKPRIEKFIDAHRDQGPEKTIE